ncbi:DUF7659 family protein [Paenibacillus illinoisensis]|uniref:DUF7659 family protein n=1 Tax=Paenibacillus illinoisensis TaxID=59845 RepID=UPI003015F334
MANAYTELKNKHQKEVNEFPIGVAFDDKQFAEAMEKLGFTSDDNDKVYSIGAGVFIRRTDSEAFGEMFKRHAKEREEAIANDATGEGYIYEMFAYELANHEYGYTYDAEPALDALDLTLEQVNADPRLKTAFNKAKRAQQQD